MPKSGGAVQKNWRIGARGPQKDTAKNSNCENEKVNSKFDAKTVPKIVRNEALMGDMIHQK